MKYFWSDLAIQIDIVFRSHSSLFDHRREYPWLTGALGNPNSAIWFIAENPSLTQIERVQNPDGGAPTPEAQWWASRGDKLFRQMLVDHGFKKRSIDSPGDWNCYITNVVKETDYASRWREKTQEARNQAAEILVKCIGLGISEFQTKICGHSCGPAEILLDHLKINGKGSFATL